MKNKRKPALAPSPFGSIVRLSRAVNIGGTDGIVGVDCEYLDKGRADVECFAEAALSKHAHGLACEVASRIREEPGAINDSAVYVIGPKNANVAKIGVAGSPYHRIAELQAGCWEPLHLHALFWIVEGSAMGVEQLSLRVAAKMDKRLRGEWVALAPEGAAYVVASVVHSANVKAADSGMWLRYRDALREERGRLMVERGEHRRMTPHLRSAHPRTARGG